MDAQITGFISAAQIRQPAGRRGGSTTSRKTATAADALEIDVPPHHERDAQTGLGGGHGAHSAMDTDQLCHQVKFLLTLIKTTAQSWVIRLTNPRKR
jgi:hypothetical protein